ncbi:type II toxin-antitoxin system RelE/ParE family toxin [Pigmentiphaga litoralis]|uniref:type II toxin-antitoxin system RelE/ParE family toxin n=1 Tax=Pigmentiphaga litoralis TaxID=516702 RepID=UPI003B42AF09
MKTRAVVKVTAAFERKLSEVETFLAEAGNTNGFDELLADLEDTLVPNLERFPSMGRPFFGRIPESIESAMGVDLLADTLRALGPHSELREIVTSHFVILYAVIADVVFLLSVRHHRQLSFDFPLMNR